MTFSIINKPITKIFTKKLINKLNPYNNNNLPSRLLIHTSPIISVTFKKWYQNLWQPITNDPPYEHICQIGDPVLRQKAGDVPTEEITGPVIKFLVDRMTTVLRKYQCVGLAAPQIGVPLNVILIEFTEKTMKAHSLETQKARRMELMPLTVLINPEIKILNYNKITFVEACESVKGYLAEVPRYEQVSVKGYDLTGKINEFTLSGWNARIMQHEIDHLNGIMYTDVMNRKSLSCSCWQAVNSRNARVFIKFDPK